MDFMEGKGSAIGLSSSEDGLLVETILEVESGKGELGSTPCSADPMA